MRSQLPPSKSCTCQTTYTRHPHLPYICFLGDHFRSLLILIWYRTNNGTTRHIRQHMCTEETREGLGCPTPDSKTNSWRTKNEEYIKFASRLLFQREGPINRDVQESLDLLTPWYRRPSHLGWWTIWFPSVFNPPMLPYPLDEFYKSI